MEAKISGVKSRGLSAKQQFAPKLLNWFTQYGRKDLPWQHNKTPYRVWLSEIMLQQTQVKTVIPYYLRFIERFTNVNCLANAAQDEVLHLWTGLGYYARARNLHKTANIIKKQYAGHFPESIDGLQALPGIGRSTAGAILSFANGQHQPILDGNVKRILCRYYRVEGWSGHSKTEKELWTLIEQLTPQKNCADFNQALMDLGSSLCSRSKPQCHDCPLNTSCEAHLNQQTMSYPQPKLKKDKPIKYTYLLMLKKQAGEFLLEQRPQQGIWGGLWSFPQCQSQDEIEQWLINHHYKGVSEMQFKTEFKHTFSHFHLLITPVIINIKETGQINDNDCFQWFNKYKPLKLGMPAPIKRLIMNN